MDTLKELKEDIQEDSSSKKYQDFFTNHSLFQNNWRNKSKE